MQLYRVLETKNDLQHKINCSSKILSYLSKVQKDNFAEEIEMLQNLILDYQTELSKIQDALNKVEVDIPL